MSRSNYVEKFRPSNVIVKCNLWRIYDTAGDPGKTRQNLTSANRDHVTPPKTVRYETETISYVAPNYLKWDWNYQNDLIVRNHNVSVVFVQNICNLMVSLIMLVPLLMFSHKLCSIAVNLIYFLYYCLVDILYPLAELRNILLKSLQIRTSR